MAEFQNSVLTINLIVFYGFCSLAKAGAGVFPLKLRDKYIIKTWIKIKWEYSSNKFRQLKIKIMVNVKMIEKCKIYNKY